MRTAFARSALKHIHDAPKGLKNWLLKQGGDAALSAALKMERDDAAGPLPETATALVAAMQQSVDETREDRRRITHYLDKAPRGEALLQGDTGRKRLRDRLDHARAAAQAFENHLSARHPPA